RRFAVERALGGDKNDIGILRIDDDARYVLRCIESDLLPCLACVGRFVDAVPMMSHHAADSMFTHPDVNNIRITFGYGDGANGTGLKISVRDIAPTDSHVVCLPQTTAGCSHVIRLRIADYASARI